MFGRKKVIVQPSVLNDDVLIQITPLIEITKHTKASASNPQGGIVKQEAPIDVSNVMYLHKGETARIQFKVEDGKKVRYAKVRGKEAEKIK